MLTSAELVQRREVVEEVVREAGEAALRRFRDRSFEVETKGPQDFVSEVDRQTEAAIRARLGWLTSGAAQETPASVRPPSNVPSGGGGSSQASSPQPGAARISIATSSVSLLI